MLFTMYNVIYHASCYLPCIMLFTIYYVIYHVSCNFTYFFYFCPKIHVFFLKINNFPQITKWALKKTYKTACEKNYFYKKIESPVWCLILYYPEPSFYFKIIKSKIKIRTVWNIKGLHIFKVPGEINNNQSIDQSIDRSIKGLHNKVEK